MAGEVVAKLGDRASLSLVVTPELIDRFAALSTDDNALHVDAAYARAAGFADRVAHGAISVAALSALIGTKLPGKGALWRRLHLDWTCPVFPGDRVTIEAEVVQASASGDSMVLKVRGKNQNHVEILRAEAIVGILGAEEAATAAARKAAPVAAAAPPPTNAADGSPATRPVLVTGGSRGIGRAIAEHVAALGHPVVVGYHANREAADAAVAAILAAGGSAQALALDLSHSNGLLDGLDAATAIFGPVLGLVHCATPSVVPAPLSEVSANDFEQFWRVYVGCLLTGLQHMQEPIRAARWGRLVFMGTSMQIGVPPARLLGYVSAKSALDGLVRALAVELGPLGATVNMLAPGMMRTDLTRHVSPRMMLAEAQKTPLRRVAEPDDVARATAFLFGEGGSFITGACIPVAGGLVMG